MVRFVFIRVLPYVLVIVAIFSVLPYFLFPVGNTFFLWGIELLVIYLLLMATRVFYSSENRRYMIFVKLFLLWNIFELIRGAFVAEIYWDWKALITNVFAYLIPLIAYSASNIRFTQLLLSKYVKIGLPIFVLLFLFIRPGAYGFYLIPISFLLIFLPSLPLRYIVLLIVFTLIVLVSDLGARSNVIKFSIPFLFLVGYYSKGLVSTKVYSLLRISFLLIPILFFILSVAGIFNPFKFDTYIEGDYTKTSEDEGGQTVEEDLLSDTRTFLYQEVLSSAMKHDYYILGRSPARGNDSNTFGEQAQEYTGRQERFSNEASILNIFTWNGVIGVILFFLVFWHSSYLSISKSNNIFSKWIGLLIAFNWMYCWVENGNFFNLNYMMIWLMVGLGLSKEFREMTNREVKIWVIGIFNSFYQGKNSHLIFK
jgi:hypothetical protein